MDRCKQILIQYWGFSTFRPLQQEIIHSVLEKKDTLALMPTGGGKSITFQVPAMAMEGICIVVTPLISLMKDQVENLKKKGIKAVAIYSGLTKEEIDIALDNCIFGDFKFLYCSPERLSTEIFKVRVQKMKINLIAVDEAHCISQWGYDFRPSYLKIKELRQLRPEVPVLALTATATPIVVADIMEKLEFKQKNIFQKSFERKNLVYVVRESESKLQQLLNILNNVKGCGIVYVRNRQKTKEIADFLQKNGITADFYHAGLSDALRSTKQDAWMKNKVRIIVATNAFGMGIDKPDVRVVVHIDLPDSPEAYFQEAGRAGRDEKKAYAVLLFNNNDQLSVNKRIESSFPELKYIKNVYNALGNYLQVPIGAGKFVSFDFNLFDFSQNYKLSSSMVYNSLKVLEQEGYIEMTEDINNPAKIHFLVNRDDLYRFQVANAAFDTFIKLLMRSYEGLFSQYVNIDEQVLAKRANTPVDNIFKYLSKLASSKIIHYIPKKSTPVIVFTEERLDEKNLYISHENFNMRKTRYIEKVESMLKYATSNNKCRSQYLLAYFGEKDVYRCGQCDVCIKRNELEISKYEFDEIIADLKKILLESPLKLETAVDNVAPRYGAEKVLKVIRWLIDNGKIAYNDEHNAYWIKN